jgi:predicted Kef-type K+ transport protein
MGTVLFIVSVGGFFAAFVVGMVASVVTITFRAIRAVQARSLAATQSVAIFHHPDPIRTPLFESLFMALALGLILVGLPAALAAIFHFVVPMIGSAATP